jgi:hypothetical protein
MAAPQNAYGRGRLPKVALVSLGSIAVLNLVAAAVNGSALNAVLGAFLGLALLISVEFDNLRAALIAGSGAAPRRAHVSAELQSALEPSLTSIQSELESVLRELLEQLQLGSSTPPQRSLHADLSARLTKVNADIEQARGQVEPFKQRDRLSGNSD